jgi:beta-glucanase (GH16 family)
MGVRFSLLSRSALLAGGCAALVAALLSSPPAPAAERTAAAASWRDDFNSLDPNTWNVIERDCFAPSNVAVSGGMLRMTIARSTRTDCPGVTGGRINTYGLRQFGPGTFEARIKFVLAPGSWQTFWLTGAGNREFPANGEVDIAEVIGRTPTNTHVALHSAFKTGGTKRCDVGAAPSATLDRVWHVYGVTTSATRVTFTIDGAKIASFTPGSTCTWPFGDPMRVLFSSRGGQYGGDVVQSAYPITYLVDWVSWHA